MSTGEAFNAYTRDRKAVITPLVHLTRSRYDQGPGLNVTAASAVGWARDLAPPWSLVRRYKAGDLTDETYTEIYTRQLETLPAEIFDVIYETGLAQPRQRLVFQCFCLAGAFCHTHILIDYLVQRYPARFCDARPLFMKPHNEALAALRLDNK